MQAYWTLTRRELAGYFVSLTGYVIMAGAVFLMGLSFVVLLVTLRQQQTPMPLTEMFYVTPFFWLILLLTTPVITMRLFALEKFSGTFETLMTTRVTDLQVVLSKFTAAFVFYAVMWLPLLACLFIVRSHASNAASLDVESVTSTYLGIYLLGALFVSLGCCASALTRSQGVAAMISLMFGMTIFLLGFLASQVALHASWSGRIIACFALHDQMHDFARGVIDSRPIVLLLTLTFFFLFLALRIVESRRWK